MILISSGITLAESITDLYNRKEGLAFYGGEWYDGTRQGRLGGHTGRIQ